MTHTTHSSQCILACVERYEAKKVAEYQRLIEIDAIAVLVRYRRHYERWSWFDHAMLNRAKDTAQKWRLLLSGTETVELSLEDSWILDY